MQRLFECGPIPIDILKFLERWWQCFESCREEMESSAVRLISFEESSVLVPNFQYFSRGFSLNQDKWKLKFWGLPNGFMKLS